jgi:1A family penicillin-binding protein
MWQNFWQAFYDEVDYLSRTFKWIFSNLKSREGRKLVAKTLWQHFLWVVAVSQYALRWYFRGLANPQRRWKIIRDTILGFIAFCFLFIGATVLWASFLQIPDLNSFEPHFISQSTQIYDRTGKILLYDLGHQVRRTVVPFDQISVNMKNATVAIEDASFYNHHGIRATSIIRAILVNILHGSLSQGGSTITQQVIKNSLLSNSKSITRKIKEWILALKLERQADKDTILDLYLNVVPYGGSIYGVEEASQVYFAKHAIDLDLAESAYLAAMTQAPSYYSPYGSHRDALEARKNLVLEKMLENKFINQDQYDQAKNEAITFQSQPANSIKAPHFAMYIIQYLEAKYGDDVVQNDGLRVTTTLDYGMQQKAEDIVSKYVKSHAKEFKATNGALVAVDPKSGQILTMVGSRDYFDTDIDGNFNVATAHRQPGSSFKPFVYATAFTKGYTPDTIIFDLDTEFSVNCTPDHVPKFPGASCYDPQNYEGGFQGPMTFRKALGNSRNIPGVKVLYLSGTKDSLDTAHAMGIESLNQPPGFYGLTLVLGGGEVSPLDMAEAYSVFGNNGARNPATGILNVVDRSGNVLEQFATSTTQAIPEQPALLMNDILSDPGARTQIFPSTYFGDRRVAMKTGTTNDSRDAWVIGYTPDISVSVWMGNNDNSPMVQRASAIIAAPMWKQFMDTVLPTLPNTPFKAPAPIDPSTLKPVLRGVWQGGDCSTDTSLSPINIQATDSTPNQFLPPTCNYNVHEILYWVNKNDPLGPAPQNPSSDPEFENWEIPVERWAASQGYQSYGFGNGYGTSTPFNNPNIPSASPKISIINPQSGESFSKEQSMTINIRNNGPIPLSKVDYFVNGSYIGSSDQPPFSFTFTPGYIPNIQENNELHAEAYDNVLNKGEASVMFKVSN